MLSENIRYFESKKLFEKESDTKIYFELKIC